MSKYAALPAFILAFVSCVIEAGASESTLAPALATSSVSIQAGVFRPQYGLEPDQKGFKVAPFFIDRIPNRKRDFKNFLKRHAEFEPGRVKKVFAETRYLTDWKKKKSEWTPDEKTLNHPTVYVSWFAANAYCESVGGRLPTTLEWEYVAAASEKKFNASKDQEFLAKILKWYSHATAIRDVKSDAPNLYGLYDLHGLIWEWTSDFNSSFITGDNREDGEQSKNLFCGNSGQGAENRANYAAFMRYAMRSSLRPNYVTEHLGFRCAYDTKKMKTRSP